jgi:DNA mismatch repair protein MutS2
LNLYMDNEHTILLISGPNAGGKTVVLKTVGLLALMARCSLYIPASEGTEFPFYEEMYADIGDEQSIETHLSTFAAHITQIRDALSGKAHSLILFDELMSQTSVEEGSALAIAILKECARRKSTVLVTTHNEELKIFASQQSCMMNAGMEFTDRPTYRLIPGIPQPSNALRIARELGLNGQVIKDAMALLDKEKMSINVLFEDLSKELRAVKEERETVSRLRAEYESKLHDLDIKKKKEISEQKEKYRTQLIKAKRSIEKMIKDFKRQGPQPDSVRGMRRFFEEKLDTPELRNPYYPKTGEMVKVRALKKVGQVVDEHGGKYKISLDNIFYWVDPLDIEKLGEDEANDR